MKAWIYIDSSGLERIALGRELFSWDISVRFAANSPPPHSFLAAAAIPLLLPETGTATILALEGLEAKLVNIKVDAAREELTILKRVNSLQVITFDAEESS